MGLISLAALLPQDLDPTRSKLHFPVFDGESHLIDALDNNPDRWLRWNSWRKVSGDFNRQFIFSLAQDRHDPTLWLFGGIWEALGRPELRRRSCYVFLRNDLIGPCVKRLYVRVALASRGHRRIMEVCLSDTTVRVGCCGRVRLFTRLCVDRFS